MHIAKGLEFRNVYIVIACSPERCTRIVEAIRPFLRRYGGMCLVSDALWVAHGTPNQEEP